MTAGELPAITERLPQNPVLIEPVENLGSYGGTWQMGMRGNADRAMIYRSIGYKHLLRWDPAWTRVIPNVAQSYSVSDDATIFTFKLREGMRWSDGHPFSAEDILFWYEDVLKNPELTPVPPQWMIAGGKLVEVEQINLHTVQFRFAAPNGLFPQLIASGQDSGGTLNAWEISGFEDAVQQKIIASRNPYYWKIDTGGQQLPYLDRVTYTILNDQQEVIDFAKAGNIGMQSRRISSPSFHNDLASSQNKGGYHFFSMTPANSNSLVIAFNLTHPDPAKRALYSNRDSRIALSLAINRNALGNQSSGATGAENTPYQIAPRPESRFYHSRLARQYTEFNPEEANALLDNIGLNKRDAQGFRLRPDGERAAVSLLTRKDRPLSVSRMTLIANGWRAIGIDARVVPLDRTDLETLVDANEHEAAQSHSGGGMEALLSPGAYLPWVISQSTFGVGWVRWFADPSHPQAQEPPAAVKKQVELFSNIKSASSPEEQEDLMKQILDIAAEQFYLIGVNLIPPQKGIVANNFHNVPQSIA